MHCHNAHDVDEFLKITEKNRRQTSKEKPKMSLGLYYELYIMEQKRESLL